MSLETSKVEKLFFDFGDRYIYTIYCLLLSLKHCFNLCLYHKHFCYSVFTIISDEQYDCSKSNSSTLEKSCDSSTTSSSRSSTSISDKKNWDQLLNDRNHVNTLIDEMFASVLEVSPNCDDEDDINEGQEIYIDNIEHNSSSISLPADATKIIVRSDSKERLFQETPANVISQDNVIVISNNLDEGLCSTTVTSVEMLPKTVIVIKNCDDSANDCISNNYAIKDHIGDGSNYNSAERAKQVNFFFHKLQFALYNSFDFIFCNSKFSLQGYRVNIFYNLYVQKSILININ